MPVFMVTLKDGADAAKLEDAKKKVTDEGGKITHESKLIKSFTAEFPPDSAHTLEEDDHVHVEADKEVTTQ
ncbi:peptidase inhibitor I9 [Aulographum hederae CBS 113979]|uniref:Peptidase inhibitor I9 n=1 Tax=Aulographum hederae CBS 113979 TaxID=1176131 RepID=A0A6G1HGT8_9PEZI|nr:peptidase inhibitor I9 [Aulographum hederae CBS 113979]